MAWGGVEEQEKERADGNPHAKNWYDEALKLVENAMREYSRDHARDPITSKSTRSTHQTTTTVPGPPETLESEYDRHRRELLEQATRNNESMLGWAAELRRYLTVMEQNVSKDMDVVAWWQVSMTSSNYLTVSDIYFLETCIYLPGPCFDCKRCLRNPSFVCTV